MKWDVLILIGVLILALVIFLIIQNKQDKEIYQKQLEDDLPTPNKEHVDRY
jgi:uncharacterized integral membrane protein